MPKNGAVMSFIGSQIKGDIDGWPMLFWLVIWYFGNLFFYNMCCQRVLLSYDRQSFNIQDGQFLFSKSSFVKNFSALMRKF